MSKVYSFRLDENNLREAQAREVIDAWVAQGYSLRHQLVEVLISFQGKGFQQNEYGELFRQIECLNVHAKEDKEVSKDLNDKLSDKFISSLKMSVKDGLKIEGNTF